MSFSEEAARAMETWFGPDMAEAVVYNGVAIRGHADYGSDSDHRTGAVMARATLMVKRSDVPAPAYRDTAVIAGVTWRVLNIESGDEHTWTLNITTNERPVPQR